MFFFGMPPARGKKGSEQSIDIKPVKRYILYFDILGYKAYFDNKENDVLEFLSTGENKKSIASECIMAQYKNERKV